MKSNTNKPAITFYSLNSRQPTKEELQLIDFEHQAGMELISWLTPLSSNISTEELLHGISKSLEIINKGVQFPIAENNNYRDLTNALGFTFGQLLHETFKWQWVNIERFDNDYVGWTIVSPNQQFGIKVEDLFYQHIMYSKDIQFMELCSLIKDNKFEEKNGEQFSFYEPWMSR